MGDPEPLTDEWFAGRVYRIGRILPTARQERDSRQVAAAALRWAADMTLGCEDPGLTAWIREKADEIERGDA